MLSNCKQSITSLSLLVGTTVERELILSSTGDQKDQYMKKAYESVLILSLLNPAANNTAFQDEIKSRALRDYGFEFPQRELVGVAVILLLDFSLTVKAATLIFISGCGSAISSAKEGKSGFIYNMIRS